MLSFSRIAGVKAALIKEIIYMNTLDDTSWYSTNLARTMDESWSSTEQLARYENIASWSATHSVYSSQHVYMVIETNLRATV
jgi:hypothetical protein